MDIFALAREAESKGLLLRALTLYREGLKRDPQFEELKAAVDHLTAQLERPRSS